MASNLGSRLQAIAVKAREDKQARKSKWAGTRQLIMEVLREAEDGLEGSRVEERNGNICIFAYGEATLQFTYVKGEEKVLRANYRGVDIGTYDLDALDRESIESELEDFVRIVSS